MIESVLRAERTVKLARSIPAGPSRDRAVLFARAAVAVLPDPADRARLAI